MGETTNHQWENVYIYRRLGGKGANEKKGKSTGKMKHVLDATSYHLPRWKWKISLKSLIWGGVCVVFEDDRRRTKPLNEWTVLKMYCKKNKEKFLEKPNLYNSPFLIRFTFTSISHRIITSPKILNVYAARPYILSKHILRPQSSFPSEPYRVCSSGCRVFMYIRFGY